MKYRYLSNFPESEVGSRSAGISGLDILLDSANSEREQAAVKAVAAGLEALSRGSITDFRALLAPEAKINVIGLDRSRVGGLPIGKGILDGLFPNGLHFEIVRAAVNGLTVFAEWLDEGEIAATGARYENLGTMVVKVDERGRILMYHEYIDTEQLYAASSERLN